MSGRHFPNWVDAYMRYTDNTEPPDIYRMWCGLGAIAAAAGDRVVYDLIAYKVWPHIYLVLVGPAGLRKTTAINHAAELVLGMPVECLRVGDDVTPEAFIQRLAHYTSGRPVKGEGGLITKVGGLKGNSVPLVCSDEFVVFLKSGGSADKSKLGSNLVDTLTALYDHKYGEGKPPWIKMTKSAGDDEIEHGGLTILAASSTENMRRAFPPSGARGGFLSRCITVHATSDMAKVIPYPSLGPANDDAAAAEMRRFLIDDLFHVFRQCRGKAQETPEARAWYIDWYTGPFQALKRASKTEDTEGFYGRYHTFLHKAALLLSLAERDDLVIEKAHLERALALVRGLEAMHHETVAVLAQTNLSRVHFDVIEFVRRMQPIPRYKVRRQFLTRCHMGARQFHEDVEKALLDARITREHSMDGSTAVWVSILEDPTPSNGQSPAPLADPRPVDTPRPV